MTVMISKPFHVNQIITIRYSPVEWPVSAGTFWRVQSNQRSAVGLESRTKDIALGVASPS